MLIRDGKEYRNLQQQVAENTDDIAELKQGITVNAYTKAESDAKFATKTEVNAKQDTLVSGTNIKTINGTSVLGSGDIIIGEGGTTVTGGTGIIVSNEGEISIDTSVVAELSDIPTVPTKTSQLTNDSGFITGINSTDVITALGYTPGTSNFSGDYDDLTDKPTIPAAVSGTNDGTNWTSLTIGSDTYGLASGGGSGTTRYMHKVTFKPNTSGGAVSGSKDYCIVVTFLSNTESTSTTFADVKSLLAASDARILSITGAICRDGWDGSHDVSYLAIPIGIRSSGSYLYIDDAYIYEANSVATTSSVMMGASYTYVTAHTCVQF